MTVPKAKADGQLSAVTSPSPSKRMQTGPYSVVLGEPKPPGLPTAASARSFSVSGTDGTLPSGLRRQTSMLPANTGAVGPWARYMKPPPGGPPSPVKAATSPAGGLGLASSLPRSRDSPQGAGDMVTRMLKEALKDAMTREQTMLSRIVLLEKELEQARGASSLHAQMLSEQIVTPTSKTEEILAAANSRIVDAETRAASAEQRAREAAAAADRRVVEAQEHAAAAATAYVEQAVGEADEMVRGAAERAAGAEQRAEEAEYSRRQCVEACEQACQLRLAASERAYAQLRGGVVAATGRGGERGAGDGGVRHGGAAVCGEQRRQRQERIRVRRGASGLSGTDLSGGLGALRVGGG